MKKIIISAAIVALLLMAFPGWAAQEVIPGSTGRFVLLNAVTSTGIGSEVDAGRMYGKWHCTVSWGGTAPTNVVVSILFSDQKGVYDGSGSGIANQTITASPTKLQITDYYGRYLKGNYISKSVGDGTTSVTISCTPVNF